MGSLLLLRIEFAQIFIIFARFSVLFCYIELHHNRFVDATFVER